MSTQANAIAMVNDVNNQSQEQSDVDVRDEYGRTASERTVELSPRAAEIVNREVEAGKHDTYDAALEYVIERGAAEIKRAREAQAKTREASRLKSERDTWTRMLELNPALVADPNVVAKMLAALGVTKKA